MSGLRTISVTRYVTPLREGGSLPAVVEGSDDGLYVVKFRGAGQGARALIAELVAGELARAAGLPVPELVFVELDAAIGRAEPDPEIRELLLASVGQNLALDYLPGSVTFDPVAEPPPDVDRASRVVLFDAFISNVDRTPKNPNLLCWHRSLWLIDHGASLYFHHAWTEADALSGSRAGFPAVRQHVLLPWAKALGAATDALAASLTDKVLEEAAARIPDAWLAGGEAQGFSSVQAHRDAYAARLRDRRQALPQLAEEAERARAQLV